MKFPRGASAKEPGRTVSSAFGTTTVPTALRARYSPTIGPSPGPTTVTTPSSDTVATVASAAENFVQRVASSVRPSVKWAITVVGCTSPIDNVTRSGSSSSRSMRGSSSVGGRRPGGEPFGEDAVIVAAGLEPHAALVRHRGGGLGEEQTAGRVARHDPPTAGPAGDAFHVRRRVVPAEGEQKAPLAGGGPVAGPHVAAPLGQHALHVVAEAPGVRGVGVLHGDGHRGGLAVGGGGERGGPVADRQGLPALHLHDGFVAGRPRRPGDERPEGAVAAAALDEERLEVLRPGQFHGRGQGGEGGRIGGPSGGLRRGGEQGGGEERGGHAAGRTGRGDSGTGGS